MTSLPDFEGLLKQQIGLDAESLGPTSLDRALEERMRTCGLQSRSAYWSHVLADPDELQALIDTVVVPETWFFRHPEAYSVMVSFLSELAARDEPARLLSLPCATGEEPASMVMALLEAGYRRPFHIDAVDVSERALARARSGRYPTNAFRGESGVYRRKYFEPEQDEYVLRQAVRNHIQYRSDNLLDASLPERLGSYDLIFCRNLLIYFDRATQREALTALRRLLKQDGLLLVGPAESALLLNEGWISLRIPHAFAFRKASISGSTAPAREAPEHPRPTNQGVRLRQRMNTTSSEEFDRTVVRAPVPEHRPTQTNSTSVLNAARASADRGQLEQAERLCHQYMQAHEPRAEAYCLLGVIHDASARSAMAEDYYRKALYLDPLHVESLVHLAILLETRGDGAAAQRLHERAQRLQQKGRGVTDG